MIPSTKRCSSIFDVVPNAQNLLPKICTKSPISRLVRQIDRRCLGLPGNFRGWHGRFNGTMQNVVGPTLVAMAMKFGLGAEIQSPPKGYQGYQLVMFVGLFILSSISVFVSVFVHWLTAGHWLQCQVGAERQCDRHVAFQAFSVTCAWWRWHCMSTFCIYALYYRDAPDLPQAGTACVVSGMISVSAQIHKSSQKFRPSWLGQYF